VELRRSQPGFALKSFATVRLAIFVESKPISKTDHTCIKLQGILTKAKKMPQAIIVKLLYLTISLAIVLCFKYNR